VDKRVDSPWEAVATAEDEAVWIGEATKKQAPVGCARPGKRWGAVFPTDDMYTGSL